MFPSSKSPRVRRNRLALGTLTAMLFAALAVVAIAAHWSHSGGDVGHSGYQPVNETGPPVSLAYTQSEGSPIRTSILTSAGSLSTQKTIYSTADGRIHFRGLDDGEPSVGTKFILSPDFIADADVLGSGQGQVSPVESSTPTALGYAFQVFNDDANAPATPTDPVLASDIAISVFRESDGSLVDTVRVPGAINYTVNQSPILFEDAIWFVATPDSNVPTPQVPPQDPNATPKLFKINIGNPSGAGGSNPTIGSTKTVNVSGATATAPTTGLYLKAADGTPAPYVAVSYGSGSTVQTFKADSVDPAVGPKSGDLTGGAAFASSVPVLSSGRTPQPGEKVETAPYLYLAVSDTEPLSDYPGAKVLKVVQDPANAANLILAPGESNTSKIVLGSPASMLAVSQLAEDPTTGDGRVVLTTGCDVYSIAVADMSQIEPLLGPNAPDACSDSGTTNLATGFRNTTAALSGNLGFVQRNNGDQIAFTIDRADALTAEEFAEVDPNDATAAFGQPAISRRLIQFGDNKRESVYRAAAFVPPLNTVSISVGDATITEGDSGTSVATFTLTKSGRGGGTVSVKTADGTATAGQDYVALGATDVTFEDSETTQTVNVTINGDTTPESDEFFKLQLSSPSSGVVITDSEGSGIIQNDDGGTGTSAGVLVVSDAVVTEGDFSNVNATFVVNLTSPSKTAVTVNYGTANKTALAGADYTTTAGTLTFAAGETAKAFSVPVRPDSLREDAEQFLVGLANAKGAGIADPLGVGTIIDDDGAPLAPYALPPTISLTVKPKRDKKKPYVFTSTGTLKIPSGVSAAKGCQGRVEIQVKAVRKTISTRRANVNSSCKYKLKVTFKDAKRFSKSGVLSFRARYLGSAFLKRAKSREVKVKTTKP